MNKFVKIMLVTSSIIAIVGIIFIGIGALTGAKMGLKVRGSGVEIIGSEKIKETDPALDEFTSIDVDLSYSDVEVVEGTGYGIEMVYYDSNYIPEYSVDQGTLFVTDNSQGEGFYNYLNLDMSFGLEKNRVIVYIPAGSSVDSYDIRIDSGNTTISLPGSTDDYIIDAKTVIGTVSLDAKLKGMKYKHISQESVKSVKLRNDIGTIKINFE